MRASILRYEGKRVKLTTTSLEKEHFYKHHYLVGILHHTIFNSLAEKKKGLKLYRPQGEHRITSKAIKVAVIDHETYFWAQLTIL